MIFDGGPCTAPRRPWPLTVGDDSAGQMTSAAWSPRFERNVALAMLEKAFWEPGTAVTVTDGDGGTRQGVVSALPMQGP